jgi:hypothetical protein
VGLAAPGVLAVDTAGLQAVVVEERAEVFAAVAGRQAAVQDLGQNLAEEPAGKLAAVASAAPNSLA